MSYSVDDYQKISEENFYKHLRNVTSFDGHSSTLWQDGNPIPGIDNIIEEEKTMPTDNKTKVSASDILQSTYTKLDDWTREHPWLFSGIVLGAVFLCMDQYFVGAIARGVFRGEKKFMKYASHLYNG